MRGRPGAVRLIACWVCLGLAAGGCETLQRKFTRKAKPRPRPNPIIQFQDYTRAMTPIDRYRKHYMMFDYWNDELMNALQRAPLNPKRYKRASTDALAELHTMRELVTDAVGPRLDRVIEERVVIDRQLQRGALSSAQAPPLLRALERQTRQVHREFFWRDVEDSLKPMAPSAAAAGAQREDDAGAP